MVARLDPDKFYGIWWFNRYRRKAEQVAVNGPEGKRYRTRTKIALKPEAEWIAVPVPESGIPREWVGLAREAIAENVKFSQNNNRPWELSGSIARCGECEWAMRAHTVTSGNSPKVNHYYWCSRVNVNYAYKACSNRKVHRADWLEPLVWDYISKVMKTPEQLRADLDRMIELERGSMRRNPGKEVKLWADQLAEADRKRARYQEMAAGDLITFDELRARLAELDETRKIAERELALLRGHEEYVRSLERDRDALIDSLEAEASEALDSLTPKQRHQ